MTHRGPFQPRPFCDSVIRWFCDSVILWFCLLLLEMSFPGMARSKRALGPDSFKASALAVQPHVRSWWGRGQSGCVGPLGLVDITKPGCHMQHGCPIPCTSTSPRAEAVERGCGCGSSSSAENLLGGDTVLHPALTQRHPPGSQPRAVPPSGAAPTFPCRVWPHKCPRAFSPIPYRRPRASPRPACWPFCRCWILEEEKKKPNVLISELALTWKQKP